MMSQYTNIINIISPRTIRQVRRNYTPYINKKLRHKKQQLHKLHVRATHTGDITDWTEYKNTKSILNKEITINKTNYINKKLDDSNDRWTKLQDINNTKGVTTPRNIIHNNIKQICDIANDHYINSIQKLRDNIPNVPVTPIYILKNIYPRNKNTFTIPLPTVSDIRNIILKSKSKNSVDHDHISIKILKKTVDIMAPVITHLTTHIILSEKFPQTFKIDSITPKYKKGMPIYTIGSYRPLNNLCTIEKVIEEYIIGHLITFLTQNNIISKFHHGGRKGHSTITALNQILDNATIQYENNRIAGIIITDMSKAFDTIDHFTLLTRMEYYGIRGPALSIFQSYLSNRMQFV